MTSFLGAEVRKAILGLILLLGSNVWAAPPKENADTLRGIESVSVLVAKDRESKSPRWDSEKLQILVVGILAQEGLKIERNPSAHGPCVFVSIGVDEDSMGSAACNLVFQLMQEARIDKNRSKVWLPTWSMGFTKLVPIGGIQSWLEEALNPTASEFVLTWANVNKITSK